MAPCAIAMYADALLHYKYVPNSLASQLSFLDAASQNFVACQLRS
jgi:hypothetical protein